jgi:hypothetical protein
MTTTTEVMTPDRIMQVGFAYWASKTLLSAVELGLFTELAKGPLDGETLRTRLGLHPRASADFFDALVALGFLQRHDGRYANSEDADLYLDGEKPSYCGGILEMSSTRLYRFWASLTEALRTGQLQNEAKTGGDVFAALYSDPARLKSFAQAMASISLGSARAIAAQFPWGRYRTMADIGTATGCLPVQVAQVHPHLTGIGLDLPALGPIFDEYVRRSGLQDRLRFVAADFFHDPLPAVDVIVMGHILHDWSLEEKRQLVASAYAALPAGGALIVYDTIIDDDRRENAFGLLMSLNMLIETPAGFDYTADDCAGWMRGAGFRSTYVEHLAGPDSMVVGMK